MSEHVFFKTLNGMQVCKMCGIAKTRANLKKRCPGYKLSEKIKTFIDKEIPS